MNLINDDCMKHLVNFKDNAFDLAIVDPPYFSGPEKRRYYGMAVSNIGVKRKDYKPLTECWEVPTQDYYNQLIRVSKNQIIWGINYFPFVNKVGAGRIIWDKVNDGTTFSNCEIASCSTQKNKVSMFRYMWRGMMQGSTADGTLMNGDKTKNEIKIHPTQKPVQLYNWLLKNYAKPADKILDTHLGSGSIAIACHRMGFDLTAFEIDKDYYDEAMKRLKTEQTILTLNL